MLKRISEFTAKVFNWLACAAIFAIMVLTCADVIGRSFWHPIFGAYDLVCMFAVVAFAFALANTQFLKGHIGVDFLLLRLGPKTQGLIEAVVYLFSIGIFLLFAWRCAVLARSLQLSGEVSMTMELPYYFFVYGLGIACLPACLVLLTDLLQSLSKIMQK